MLENSKAYSGFAVDHLKKAEQFYGETLGLKTEVIDEQNGLMTLHLAGDRPTLVYQQQGSTPASYTILNFPVDDIDEAVDELASVASPSSATRAFRSSRTRRESPAASPLDRGPDIAWFKDPAGKHSQCCKSRNQGGDDRTCPTSFQRRSGRRSRRCWRRRRRRPRTGTRSPRSAVASRSFESRRTIGSRARRAMQPWPTCSRAGGS